jgi:hypothetical protein
VLGCGSGGGGSETCAPINLLAPDGSRYDLSGTWSGNDGGLYYLKQIDNCVWWSGMSNFAGHYPGEDWIMTFKGHVTDVGVITGQFVDVKSTNPGSGTMTIEIRPEDVGGQQVLSLHRTELTGHAIGVSFWQRVVESPSPRPVQTPPQF